MQPNSRRPVAAVAGYDRFVRNKFLNYQLNRWRALGDLDTADVREVARTTRDAASCATAFTALAERLESDNDAYRAAYCHRAAEFSTSPDDPAKGRRYQRFRELFYASEAAQDVEAGWLQYGHGAMATLRVPARTARPRGQVVAFGGFDSCIEDFHLVWTLFAQAGYEVIAFDGPGQGATRRLRGLLFDHDWEHPTAAILDALGARSVTLLGLSMGGYWAVRAAAFEKRIARLVLMPPLLDWMDQAGPLARRTLQLLMRSEKVMNGLARLKMAAPPIRHTMDHARYVCGGKEPIDAIRWLLAMNRDHVRSELVTQDVLLLGGETDAFQPASLVARQAEAMVAARSVSSRIFTAAEGADQHCQIGNLPLACDAVARWLDRLS